jgi:hypothetical protein
MEESELREQIKQKISEGTLPRDISVFSTYPVDFAVKEARGEPCSVCGRPIAVHLSYGLQVVLTGLSVNHGLALPASQLI